MNRVDLLSKHFNQYTDSRKVLSAAIRKIDSLIGTRYEQVPFCKEIDLAQLILHSKPTDTYVLYVARFNGDEAELVVSVAVPDMRQDKSGLESEVEFLRQELKDFIIC